MKALDLETAPKKGHPQPYALQPWRVREGTAKITSCAIARETGNAKTVPGDVEQIQVILDSLEGAIVATWNGVFDLAWLYAYDLDITKIKWVDAQMLWKWHSNSQFMERIPRWNLAAGAKRWCKDEKWLSDFVAMKEAEVHAGENDQYWETRGKMDAYVTALIAHRIWPLLTEQQQKSVMIEAACMVPTAQSWVDGIYMDRERALDMGTPIEREMRELEKALGLTQKILASPAQLAAVMYDTWGLPVEHMTDGGKSGKKKPATNKAALTYMADRDPRMIEILRWRELNTQWTKFIEGVRKTGEYLNSSVMHPQPKIFSTYTGRFTYKSRSGQKGEAYKAKIGVPIHQWPRPKDLRKLLIGGGV